MSQTRRDTWLKSLDSKRKQTGPHTSQAWVNGIIKAEILDIDKHVGYSDGLILDKLICTKNEVGWLAIVKAHRNGRKRVAYVQGATFDEAMELVGEFAARGCLTWQVDKPPPKRLFRAKP